MDIHILAGGPEALLPDLTHHNKNCRWIGVDRGVYTLLKNGIVPEAAFGDFDSVTEHEYVQIVNEIGFLHKYKPEKDETDTELAFNWALAKKAECIRLFGATGGRQDHFLANMQLLYKALSIAPQRTIEIIDRKNIISAKNPGSYTLPKIAEKKYISFLPVSATVEGLTLEGFKYPLNDCHISLGSTLCISNELIAEYGTFSFRAGILMVVRSSD
ncbi:thiamine diphosphokinase [Bacillaceae bacterium Marseille-Q3522]|nr:thiamine diphosphokinase [Bacillaceae bacterium Marseille-Q3522]